MLPTRPRRAEHLLLVVVLADLDLDVALVQHRCDLHCRERSLALALRVERAHANEPVYASLALQPAVRIPALHDELDRGQSRLAPWRRRFLLDLEPVPLRPPH